MWFVRGLYMSVSTTFGHIEMGGTWPLSVKDR